MSCMLAEHHPEDQNSAPCLRATSTSLMLTGQLVQVQALKRPLSPCGSACLVGVGSQALGEGHVHVMLEKPGWAGGEVGCTRVSVGSLTLTPAQMLSP